MRLSVFVGCGFAWELGGGKGRVEKKGGRLLTSTIERPGDDITSVDSVGSSNGGLSSGYLGGGGSSSEEEEEAAFIEGNGGGGISTKICS